MGVICVRKSSSSYQKEKLPRRGLRGNREGGESASNL